MCKALKNGHKDPGPIPINGLRVCAYKHVKKCFFKLVVFTIREVMFVISGKL